MAPSRRQGGRLRPLAGSAARRLETATLEPTMDTRRAIQRDLVWLRALLDESGLPALPAGVPLANVVVALEGHEPIGGVCLEVHGRSGLLLSVVVAPERRRRGVGTSLVQSIVARAHEIGLQDLYVLEGESAAFFEALGFEEIERSELPGEIRSAPAFKKQSPESSAAMRLPLATRW